MSTSLQRNDNSVANWLASPATMTQLRAALPTHFAPDRMARLALTALRTTRGLPECEPASTMACIMTAAQLGLEIGVLGSAYLVPRRSKNGPPQCTLIIGYQGLLDLVRRSGQVRTIASRIVYRTDTFEIAYDEAVPYRHRPNLDRPDNDPIVGFYCHAILTSGEHVFEWMTKREVDGIRVRFAGRGDSPWDTDYGAMGRKTILRRAAKYLPRSVEMADALEIADKAEAPAYSQEERQVHFTTAPSTMEPSTHGARVPTPPPPPLIAAPVAPANAEPNAPADAYHETELPFDDEVP